MHFVAVVRGSGLCTASADRVTRHGSQRLDRSGLRSPGVTSSESGDIGSRYLMFGHRRSVESRTSSSSGIAGSLWMASSSGSASSAVRVIRRVYRLELERVRTARDTKPRSAAWQRDERHELGRSRRLRPWPAARRSTRGGHPIPLPQSASAISTRYTGACQAHRESSRCDRLIMSPLSFSEARTRDAVAAHRG